MLTKKRRPSDRRCFTDTDSDLAALVVSWNRQSAGRAGTPGTVFNYNELCPLSVGLAIRHAAGMSLSELAEEALWQPMGAEADATWSTDSMGKEFCCVGFGETAAAVALHRCRPLSTVSLPPLPGRCRPSAAAGSVSC